MKSLLFVITQGHWGGAQKYVYDLAAALAGEFDITVAIGDQYGEPHLQKRLQVTGYRLQVIQLQHLGRAISPIHDLLALWELKRLYKQVKPDIIHLNSSKAGILGSLAKFCIPHSAFCILYTVHGWVFDEPLPWLIKRLYRWLEKATARWKDRIIVLSEKDRQTALQNLNIPTRRLALIPNGIAPVEFLPRQTARTALLLPADGLIIGTLANHYQTKGLDVLLEAVAPLKKEMDNLHLVIIGDGPERPRLEAMIGRLGLGAMTRLSGFRAEAAEYLPAFDIFVLPSRKEGLPFTLLEAMQAGLPIVATTAGAIPTIITNNEHGLLVPPESPVALRLALQKLMADQADRERLGLAAKSRAADFSLAKQITATTTLYRSLLHLNPPLAEAKFH